MIPNLVSLSVHTSIGKRTAAPNGLHVSYITSTPRIKYLHIQ